MIKTVADLLQEFVKEEAKKLDTYKMSHGPTIGSMYEGLSAELLERSIPKGLDIKIVNGFVTDGGDGLTGQIDCMLVRGEGEKVPYTNTFKWHVRDVIAVFEIKKNLYSKDLIDSFLKLRQISDSYSRYLFEGKKDRSRIVDLTTSYRIFSQLTGVSAPNYHDRETLSKENELIYTSVFMEQLTPVRIVLGYDGFSTEYSLRDGFIRYLENQGSGPGFGIPSFPHLIICGSNSLVKCNGRPYLSPMRDGYWDFFCSSRANPILLMLEFIWSKIELEYGVKMPWGEDLENEGLNEFMRAKPHFDEKVSGWHYKYEDIPESVLTERSSTKPWEPLEISSAHFVVYNNLAQSDVDISDADFEKFAIQEAGSVDAFIKPLISSGFVSQDGKKLRLTTVNLMAVVTPDGRFMVAENNSGRLESWLKKYKSGKG